MEEKLKIGLIQTTIDLNIAWSDSALTPMTMHHSEADRVWEEIKKGFAAIKTESNENFPHFVIMPELTVPLFRERELYTIAKKLGIVIIAGLDFIDIENRVKNEAIVIVPNKWPKVIKSSSVDKFYFGKAFFSVEEKRCFKNKGKEGMSSQYMHIIDAGDYGNIGVAICSDFFDLERFVIYKGKIHHMIVIAYNKDVKSYYFLAEAISRLVYCNVIICNTGYYGGSVVFSPYRDDYKRYIYKLEGSKIFNVQVVSIPVKTLDFARKTDEDKEFKSRPPGYEDVMRD